MNRQRIAILMSHPIPYKVGLLKKIARCKEIEMTALFCSDFGAKTASYDKQFGANIKWGENTLHGYNYKILKQSITKPYPSFWGQINFDIFRVLKEERYDYLVLHGWSAFTNWLAFAYCALFNKRTKMILTGENPLNQEIDKPAWKRTLKKFFLCRLLFPRIEAFLYIGTQNKKFYLAHGVPDKKLFFSPYSVDNHRFRIAAQKLSPRRDAIRKELGMGQDDVAIIFVGKFIQKKRPADLLKAFELLQTQYGITQRIHLLFIGDGPQRSQLDQYVADNHIKNVHFLGFQSQDELPKYLTAADIFVLPSGAGETWGLVTNEALNFGLPVAISDVPGAAYDLVIPDKNGYRFPVDNPDAMAQKLELLVNDKGKRHAFGRKSLELIESWSYDTDVNGLLAAIHKHT